MFSFEQRNVEQGEDEIAVVVVFSLSNMGMAHILKSFGGNMKHILRKTHIAVKSVISTIYIDLPSILLAFIIVLNGAMNWRGFTSSSNF